MAKTEKIKVTSVLDGSQTEKTLRDLRDEVKQYRDQLVNLDRTSKEYNQTLNALGQAQGKINDIMIDGRAAANAMDGSFNNLVTVSRTLAAGFSSLQGVTALLGSENKALNETFVRLQASMNLFISLSRFNANAIKQTTVAFQTLTRVMLANPFVLIGTLLATLLIAFESLREELGFIIDPVIELWEALDDLLKPIGGVSGAFNILKSTIASLFTVIIRFYSGPIKALIKILRGDLTGALEEAKNGFNLLGNAIDGFNNQQLKNIKKASKEQLSEIDKLNKQIIKQSEKLVNDGTKLANKRQQEAEQAARERLRLEQQVAQGLKKFYDEDESNRIAALGSDELKEEIEAQQTLLLGIRTALESSNIPLAEKARLSGLLSDETSRLNALTSAQTELENKQRRDNEEKIAQLTKISQLEQQRDQNLQNYSRSLFDNIQLIIQDEEARQEQLDSRIEAIKTELLNEELANERRIELLTELRDAEQEYFSVSNSLAANKKKVDADLLKAEEDAKKERIKVSNQLLSNAISVFGEQSAVGKAAAVATTTIETYKGAMQAFNAFSGIPIVGPALGIAAAAAATTLGLANIREILKVKTPGGDNITADTGSVSLPSFPETTEAIQETHNNMNEYDVEQLNNTQQRVYVVESDITATQNNVQKARVRATY